MIPALPYRELSLHWQGQLLSVRYTSLWWQMAEYAVAHLEIMADRPLPNTATGYRSHFIQNPPDDLDPLVYVAAWLEDAAADPAWCAQYERERQGSLF